MVCASLILGMQVEDKERINLAIFLNLPGYLMKGFQSALLPPPLPPASADANTDNWVSLN
jgi:hypothetical protein